MSVTPEEWRPVPGFTDYQVSDHGRVMSYKRRKPRLLRPWTNQDGYLHLALSRDKVPSSLFVHQLVALAFIGPLPQGQVTRHLDGDPANNVVGNLVYGSRSENALDSLRHGTHVHGRKNTCPEGHPYDELNTYYWRGCRKCRTCRRAAGYAYRQQQKELAAAAAA